MRWLIFICVLLPLLAPAQDRPADSTYVLQEMTISATRFPEPRSRVAQQVYTIGPAAIPEANVQTTADLLANSGVVTVQKSQQGGGSARLRGFEANRVLLVIDGVRMNNLIYRSGHLQNMITVDQHALESVEVLFGPSSTVYGSDALGGVIHFMTKDPELSAESEGSASVRYSGANNETTVHAGFRTAGSTFGIFSSVTASTFGDLRMGGRPNRTLGKPFGLREDYVVRTADNSADMLVANQDVHLQKSSGYDQLDVVQKFLFRRGPRADHTLNIQLSTSSDIPRYDRLTERAGSGLRYATWSYGPQLRSMAAYRLRTGSIGRIADKLHTTLSFQHLEESRHFRRFGAPAGRHQTERVGVWGLTADFLKTIAAPAHTLRYGIDGQLSGVVSEAHDKDVITGARTAAPTRYPDGFNRLASLAAYATHTWQLSGRLIVTDGLRAGWSHLRARFDDKTFFPFPFAGVDQRNAYGSGNAGLIFLPDGRWKFSLMAATGYRVPNTDDLAKVFDSNAGEVLIVPNPALRPEKTLNLEFSAARFSGEKFQWENAFFYTVFSDAIVLDAFALDGAREVMYDGQPAQVMANQNRKHAFVTGFSSVLRAALSSAFSTDASLNFTRGRVRREGGTTPLDHIPPLSGRAGVRYQQKKVDAGVYVLFNGWKRIGDYALNSEDNEIYAPPGGTPSWYTLHARVALQVGSHVTLQGGIDNALDLQYRTFASGINAAGRNLFATLRLRL